MKCSVDTASLNWKEAFTGFTGFTVLYVLIGKLPFNSFALSQLTNFFFLRNKTLGNWYWYYIYRIFDFLQSFREAWCLKCIYRFRIMSWYCCTVQVALFSRIPLLLLASVLHWKTLQAQTNFCFWHCAYGSVVLPHEALMAQIIIAKATVIICLGFL